MTSTWVFVVCEIAVIACGLVAGVFLTFSDFIMRSLDGAKPAAGSEAATYWARTYVPRWTFWNAVRAVASAAVRYLAACVGLAQGTLATT